MTWLDRTPIAIVWAYLRMIPCLQADEALSAKNQIGVGTGSFERADARQIVADWIRAARRGARSASAKASPSSLSAMGIGYRVVPPS